MGLPDLCVLFRMAQLMLPSVFRWGHAHMLAEYPVKLGKTVETTGGTDLCDGDGGVDQHGLHIADACHLNIVSNSKAGHSLKLMGQVIAAEEKLLRQMLQ